MVARKARALTAAHEALRRRGAADHAARRGPADPGRGGDLKAAALLAEDGLHGLVHLDGAALERELVVREADVRGAGLVADEDVDREVDRALLVALMQGRFLLLVERRP